MTARPKEGPHPHRPVAHRLPAPRHGAHGAVFSWAYARHFGGDFILRIEDTDVANAPRRRRCDQIIEAMRWLELHARRRPVLPDAAPGALPRGDRDDARRRHGLPLLVHDREELDAMREAQRARGEKPRYDGRWRPRAGKRPAGTAAEGVKPPSCASQPARTAWSAGTTWSRARSASPTARLDDLIIARPAADGQCGRRRRGHRPTTSASWSTTWDMGITPCLPRRRPCQQHATADQHPARAAGRGCRCRSTATCR